MGAAGLGEGRLDEADRFFRAVEKGELEAADRRLKRAAAHRGERAQIALTEGRARDAAEHFKRASDLCKILQEPEKVVIFEDSV